MHHTLRVPGLLTTISAAASLGAAREAAETASAHPGCATSAPDEAVNAANAEHAL